MSTSADPASAVLAAGAPPLGLPRHHFAELGSTSDEARRLAGEGAPHGTTVTTEHQTAGRGRQGRTWVAPAGQALLVSVVLRDLQHPLRLPLAAAVAVAATVDEPARIKWPNDIVFVAPEAAAGAAAGPPAPLRKVAGILCEGGPGLAWAVVGIGINVAVDLSAMPEEVAAQAASMGRPPEQLDAVLAELLVQLDVALKLPFAELLAAWSARDALRGRAVIWERGGDRGGSGVADGIDDQGRLRVLSGAELHLLDAGEVHLSASAPG